MTYKVLKRFQSLFNGVVYRHRAHNNGDKVALELFEDLLDLGKSPKFVHGVKADDKVVNTKNLITGKENRRGDGSFGALLPHLTPNYLPGYNVPRGPIANIEIGVETKILAKAMIKQVDRVMSDLENQARVFRANGNPICVAIVGINQAPHYISHEGNRSYPTDGTAKYRHPIDECVEAEKRIRQRVAPLFDELIILPFEATNAAPFRFGWPDSTKVTNEYGAALLRISQEYDKRF
ncbi:hypothetical protein [Erythrobacter sp. HKB08]|uniref:hypothetical protein n=1 Tax=Erythrobacter sp. HKB08 TaxID=2502843 RepID=UPI001008FA7F|nr:hypothetical protein [Erythrobacter sp. HKB08]